MDRALGNPLGNPLGLARQAEVGRRNQSIDFNDDALYAVPESALSNDYYSSGDVVGLDSEALGYAMPAADELSISVQVESGQRLPYSYVCAIQSDTFIGLGSRRNRISGLGSGSVGAYHKDLDFSHSLALPTNTASTGYLGSAYVIHPKVLALCVTTLTYSSGARVQNACWCITDAKATSFTLQPNDLRHPLNTNGSTGSDCPRIGEDGEIILGNSRVITVNASGTTASSTFTEQALSAIPRPADWPAFTGWLYDYKNKRAFLRTGDGLTTRLIEISTADGQLTGFEASFPEGFAACASSKQGFNYGVLIGYKRTNGNTSPFKGYVCVSTDCGVSWQYRTYEVSHEFMFTEIHGQTVTIDGESHVFIVQANENSYQNGYPYTGKVLDKNMRAVPVLDSAHYPLTQPAASRIAVGFLSDGLMTSTSSVLLNGNAVPQWYINKTDLSTITKKKALGTPASLFLGAKP